MNFINKLKLAIKLKKFQDETEEKFDILEKEILELQKRFDRMVEIQKRNIESQNSMYIQVTKIKDTLS